MCGFFFGVVRSSLPEVAMALNSVSWKGKTPLKNVVSVDSKPV